MPSLDYAGSSNIFSSLTYFRDKCSLRRAVEVSAFYYTEYLESKGNGGNTLYCILYRNLLREGVK